MYDLTDINTIKKLMDTNKSGFKKSLGQNFLIEPDICPQMAMLCGADKTSGVLEIGPGIGVLTVELAEVCKKVVSFEADLRLKTILDKTLVDFDNITVIYEDFLKCNLKKIKEEYFGDVENICVCANLPYYITSPILMKLLEENPGFKTITLMVQKEAGDRLCAEIGSRNAGAVSVAVEKYAKREMLFDVDRSCFYPSPNVDSCVVKFTLRSDDEKYDIKNLKLFDKIVKSGFGKRRKTISNCLNSDLGIPKDEIAKALKTADIGESARLESLNMEKLINLCENIDKING